MGCQIQPKRYLGYILGPICFMDGQNVYEHLHGGLQNNDHEPIPYQWRTTSLANDLDEKSHSGFETGQSDGLSPTEDLVSKSCCSP